MNMPSPRDFNILASLDFGETSIVEDKAGDNYNAVEPKISD